MQSEAKSAKLVIKDGWGICPVCGNRRFLKVRPDTSARNLPRLCKRCKQESVVNIEAPAPASEATSA